MSGDVPISVSVPRLQRSDMEKYQRRISAFVKATPRCAVWADMGSGKSISSLTAFTDLFDSFDAGRVLVVAPLRVAKKTWADEIRDWAHTRHLRFLFLDGSLKSIGNKILKNLDKVDVWAISCDKVRLLEVLFGGRALPWDVMIIDESSRFKNSEAKRTRALKLLTVRPLRIIELTGTPLPNGLEDIWSQIYMLDRGERLGRSMKAFKDRWYEFNDKSGKQELKPHARKQIMDAISDIVYVLRPEEFTSVKKPMYNYIKLTMPAELEARYKKFKKDLVLKLEDGETITATNSAALATKLLQFASGAVYDEEHNAKTVHRIKVDALREIVDDNPGKPILVAYNFKHDIPRILKEFPYAEVFGKDPKQQDKWNRGEIQMLIAHPKSAAHGLNLQFGGHILVWFSYPGANLEDYLQMNKRLPRPGQLHQVMIHHLIVEKTVDEMVMNALNHKGDEQDVFQADLKELIRATRKELRNERVQDLNRSHASNRHRQSSHGDREALRRA